MQAQLSEIVRASFLFEKFVMLLLYPPSSGVVRRNTEVNVAIRLKGKRLNPIFSHS